MYKIDVLMPCTSQYGVLHHFTQKIFEALVRSGYACRLLEGDERYTAPLISPPDFTLGFNGALRIQEKEGFLCNFLRIPHVSCLVDPPYRFTDLASNPYIILTCDDQACCAFAKRLSFPHVLFMPHAVERELEPDPLKEKVYDIAMLATFIDCERRRHLWRNQFPPSVFEAMEEAIGVVMGNGEISFIQELQRALEARFGYADLLASLPRKTMCRAFEEVELYIKGRDRIDLIEAIPDRNIHVFGGSIDGSCTWEAYFSDKKNIICHPQVSYSTALDIMKQSKVILNSSIKNPMGSHERIFSAMASGAVVVTNNNSFLRKYYTHGESILFYRRKDLTAIAEAVSSVLDDESKRDSISKNARAQTTLFHTWDHRVVEFLPKILSMITSFAKDL